MINPQMLPRIKIKDLIRPKRILLIFIKSLFTYELAHGINIPSEITPNRGPKIIIFNIILLQA